jgi:putative SOS response-associated peptidase YedK
MFCSAFKRNRCIVPASGYYEWHAAEGGKQPYFISAADGTVLSIAGLWDQWKEPETGETVLSAILIITAANDFTRPIHDRMPVLLGRQNCDAWLTGKAGVELLRPRGTMIYVAAGSRLRAGCAFRHRCRLSSEICL